ncbi:hypothetical protein GCM10011514_04370 [Emticicia aquatilis]|uniref:Uncharacterized protein n=1 Tax=Emticicia aquatilis TaxID=1537369 RepID=A0A916YGB6_9BACT|nr:hypothetical protein GCM10011514_04370 [Emticicia aquatilis]
MAALQWAFIDRIIKENNKEGRVESKQLGLFVGLPLRRYKKTRKNFFSRVYKLYSGKCK